MIQQQLNIDRFHLTAADKNFLEHKRCFLHCVNKEFKQPSLKDEQKLCIRNCLHRYRDAEKFMVEKIHHTMKNLIRSDMNLMSAYQEEESRQGKSA